MWFTDGDRLCVLRKFPLAHYVQLTLADKEVKKYLLCCHHCLLTSRNCVTGDQCYKSQSVFLLGDPLVSVHWEYRGNFLGVCFKVSTINPFLGSNFRTNEFKWSKYRRQCWYSLSWCDSSFLACSPYTSGLEQWVLDFSPNLSQKEKRYTLAILFGI